MSVVKKTNINPDLDKERQKCTFNTVEFTNWWYGGVKEVEKKRWQERTFLDAPELEDKVPLYYLSHKEIYEETMRKLSIVVQKSRQIEAEKKDGVQYFQQVLGSMPGSGITQHGSLLGVHYGMFIPTIAGQGTEEQQAEWLPKSKDLSIIGTYAQTELGHGTFVRGLETTATYDPKTQEFVLNSPTLSSYKWWPGGLAHTANHCILLAQLISQGKRQGVYAFVIQIRDTETHMPLPGVRVGEIGAKLGIAAVNNGYLGFDNVRIPRKSMLMKNAQVSPDGTFTKVPSSNVLTYGTMLLVRVYIVRDMASFTAQAATIATRYAAVRKQSQIKPNEPEVQIMDHLTQQLKLFPQIAKAVILKVSADYLMEMYTGVTSELEKGNLERLPELHALSCCLKSITTTDGSNALETCRLACGGHGYLTSSSFCIKYGQVTAAVTYEGENTIMLLQTARYLLKSWRAMLDNRPLTPTVAYLKKAKSGYYAPFSRTIHGIIEAYQTAAAHAVQIAYENLEKRKAGGLTQEEAFNATSIELAKAAELHGRCFLLESGYTSVNKCVQQMSPELGKVLLDLIELYAVDSALSNMSRIIPFVQLSRDDLASLQDRLETVLARIRPNAVGICDSFDFADKMLNSTLGSYDGRVYERLFEEAMKSPLNQEPVNKSFELYLKPLMRKKNLPSKL